MPPKIKIYRSGELIRETEGTKGESLLERIAVEGVFLDSPCGGRGKCGKCLVSLSPGGAQVLACRTYIDGDMEVYLPDDMDMKIAGAVVKKPGAEDSGQRKEDKGSVEYTADSVQLGDGGGGSVQCTVGSVQLEDEDVSSGQCAVDSGQLGDGVGEGQGDGSARRRLGVAVDIGTTTVVAHLTELDSGERIATASGVNAQRTFGADVISRIQYCADNGHETLTRVIREQLASLILETCAASSAREEDIGYISIAANTIMEHLAAGYSPVGMGVVPFEPVSLFGEELAATGLPVSQAAKVYYAPAISSYVGGDITAGMLAAKLEDTQGPVVYLDIGTNGEIALKSGDRYYCCATAAGPAFEGAEISMGMAAVSGAVNHVKWDGGLEFSVIGEGSPRGLCGSGLLDALSVLLETGAVDETGRMLDQEEIEHDIAEHIGKMDGKNVFWLTKGDGGVFMTAADIRKLQLAKSAISAGIQTLLHYAGIAEDQVVSFVLAGGFGSYMDQYSAARIGLFPKSFLPISQTLGNTAGEGAAIALCSKDARAVLSDIRRRCEYIELSTSPMFNEQFVEQMMF